MVARLNNPERLIINQLIDTGLFINAPLKSTNELTSAAVSLKRTAVQNRINNYLQDLIGQSPENIQENLLLVLGTDYESAETVHVLLATLKAVINLPELQGVREDRAVLTNTIIRQVHSEVVDLGEKEIYQQITKLFVDQFKLFLVDSPETAPSEQTQEIAEYWIVSSSFVLVAQAIVDKLISQNEVPLTDIQRINRALLINRYISPRQSPRLWEVLLNNKAQIAEQWANLDRFDLECGDDYALLLDKKRSQMKSMPVVIAIDVSHKIHAGISEVQLNQVIKDSTERLFPKNDISPSKVRNSLTELGIVQINNQFVYPTPLVKRFAVGNKMTEEVE